MVMKKIRLIGKDGQVGLELQKSLSTIGDLVAVGRGQLDLGDLEGIRACIRLHQPDVIVNAAAYTAVDRAEAEPEKARLINSLAVAVMAEEAAQINAWLVHYSTDYIFDGSKDAPYVENDPAVPLNVYGQTKWVGEQAIRNSGGPYLIFRTSWVFGVYGHNFLLTILKNAMARDRLEVVSDQVGAPTSASLIADISAKILYRIIWDPLSAASASGTYHLVASGKTSWYDYAKFLLETARGRGIAVRVAADNIVPVGSDFYKTVAKRPKNSQMANQKLCQQFGLVLPDWQVGVDMLVNELAQSGRFALFETPLERFRFSSTLGRQGEARGAYTTYVSTVSPQPDDV
jgi:dTDP-4-dehydrorhamnose reductase